MRDFFTRFWRDETGTAAIEYGIIAATISVPLVNSAKTVATAINTTFGVITAAMN